METWLDSPEDMQWLHDVHGVNTTGFIGAILFGNEDAPEKVELYRTDDYRSQPVTVFLPL